MVAETDMEQVLVVKMGAVLLSAMRRAALQSWTPLTTGALMVAVIVLVPESVWPSTAVMM